MFNFLIKRLLQAFLTFFGVSLLAFTLIRLVPGDPVRTLVGERGAAPEVIAEMRKNLGLDKPLPIQYGLFAMNALKGDLGVSIVTKRPVSQEFFDRFPATFELGMVALIFAMIIGIPAGVIAASKRNTPIDYLFMGGSLVGYSMPIFWWGLLLILFFSVTLGLTPVAGRINVIYEIPNITGLLLIDTLFSEEGLNAFFDAVRHLILPSLAMGTIPMAIIARMTRSSMLEVLGEDYIRTARAKGLDQSKVLWAHAFKNALIPIITVTGLMLGSILTGAILTESIFSWPGIGKWMVHSVMQRDYPVIQGGILLISVTIVIVNTLVDISYGIVNPRLREKK